MSKYSIVNIDTWKRKPHFEFFNGYEDPGYGLTVNLDCTNAYTIAKRLSTSFFLFYLHKSITAVNQIEAFKLRIDNEVVRKYDHIDVATTINRSDGTFGFSHLTYKTSFPSFAELANEEIARVQARRDLEPSSEKIYVVHYSTLPWVSFTALEHPRQNKKFNGIPKITFGRVFKMGNRMLMPMSVHVHHALVDGRDIGDYVDCMQDLLNNIE